MSTVALSENQLIISSAIRGGAESGGMWRACANQAIFEI